MMNVQGVAMDMGDSNPSAVGADGQPAKRQFKLEFQCDEDGVFRAAKEARLRNDVPTAERLESMIGKKATVSVFERHPVITGIAIGTLSTVVVGTGVYYTRRWYKNRQAMKLQPPGRVRMRAVS